MAHLTCVPLCTRVQRSLGWRKGLRGSTVTTRQSFSSSSRWRQSGRPKPCAARRRRRVRSALALPPSHPLPRLPARIGRPRLCGERWGSAGQAERAIARRRCASPLAMTVHTPTCPLSPLSAGWWCPWERSSSSCGATWRACPRHSPWRASPWPTSGWPSATRSRCLWRALRLACLLLAAATASRRSPARQCLPTVATASPAGLAVCEPQPAAAGGSRPARRGAAGAELGGIQRAQGLLPHAGCAWDGGGLVWHGVGLGARSIYCACPPCTGPAVGGLAWHGAPGAGPDAAEATGRGGAQVGGARLAREFRVLRAALQVAW